MIETEKLRWLRGFLGIRDDRAIVISTKVDAADVARQIGKGETPLDVTEIEGRACMTLALALARDPSATPASILGLPEEPERAPEPTSAFARLVAERVAELREDRTADERQPYQVGEAYSDLANVLDGLRITLLGRLAYPADYSIDLLGGDCLGGLVDLAARTQVIAEDLADQIGLERAAAPATNTP